MNVQAIRQGISAVDVEWLALGIFDDQESAPEAVKGTPLGELIGRLLASKELSGDVGSALALHGVAELGAGAVLVFGLGSRENFGEGPAFLAGVAASKRLASKPRKSVAVALSEGVAAPSLSALVAGMVVGTRGPDLRKTEKGRHPFETLQVLIGEGAEFEKAVERGVIVGDAINLARDLANTPPAEKSPTMLAERARVVAEASGLGVQVWGESKIREERFGGLLAVSAGSDEPPAFVILEHMKGGDAPTLALVGKGVTFDSGGLSLKPSASMEDMKSDMTGSAVVLATLSAVAKLDLPVNVRGYMVVSENMTGGKAMKLGDVLTIRNGKTVEVLNTDAEGRLILGDALSYACESKPDRVLDLATLTGACLVALGTKVAGLFANDDAFAADVAKASATTGERVWRLPLDDDYKEALKSHVADMKNVGSRWGGAITAAKFLQEFVGEARWVHLDIAGPSWSDSDGATRDAGGTGCYVRTLIALIEASASGSSS